MLDLFQIARNNSERLRGRCPDGAAEFLRVVDEESTVGINLGLAQLRGFLARGEYLNRHRLPEQERSYDIHGCPLSSSRLSLPIRECFCHIVRHESSFRFIEYIVGWRTSVLVLAVATRPNPKDAIL